MLGGQLYRLIVLRVVSLYCGKRIRSRWLTLFKISSLFLFVVSLTLASLVGSRVCTILHLIDSQTNFGGSFLAYMVCATKTSVLRVISM